MCRPDDFPPYGEDEPAAAESERQARALAVELLEIQMGSVADALALLGPTPMLGDAADRQWRARVERHIRKLGKAVE